VRLVLTATAYPPSIGGAQLLMHQLARQLEPQHAVEAVTQWTTNRTDWLLGTTLKAPRKPSTYSQDGVTVHQITLPETTRRRLAPLVLGYYAVQGMAVAHIATALAEEMEPFTGTAELIHNCRIGREGLSYASFQLARKKGIPFVFTPLHHPRWGTWLHRHFHRLYRQADAVIALTQGERKLLAGLGVDERRVHVTGMGPVLAEGGDGRRFREAHQLGSDPIVLFLGQKYAYKGTAALMSAVTEVWQKYPETRFVFIGPRTSYSRQLFGKQLDPRILELDAVNLQTKTDALAACTVLCVPSLQESFGGVYTEAWSLGKPVIGGDIAAVRSVIADGDDGFVVPQQPTIIAERLLWILKQPALAEAMGRRGQAKVIAHYTWPRLAEQTERVYEHVLRQGG
jgi:glycosyltransferase involved in cell wall biosynthesis